MDVTLTRDAARRVDRATGKSERQPKGIVKARRAPRIYIPQWLCLPVADIAARASGAQMISGKVTLVQVKDVTKGLLTVPSPVVDVIAWNYTGGVASKGVLCVITWVNGLWLITSSDCSGVANGLTPA